MYLVAIVSTDLLSAVHQSALASVRRTHLQTLLRLARADLKVQAAAKAARAKVKEREVEVLQVRVKGKEVAKYLCHHNKIILYHSSLPLLPYPQRQRRCLQQLLYRLRHQFDLS